MPVKKSDVRLNKLDSCSHGIATQCCIRHYVIILMLKKSNSKCSHGFGPLVGSIGTTLFPWQSFCCSPNICVNVAYKSESSWL